MHRHYFGIFSQNPEYVGNYCNNGNNPFDFAGLKWIINQ